MLRRPFLHIAGGEKESVSEGEEGNQWFSNRNMAITVYKEYAPISSDVRDDLDSL